MRFVQEHGKRKENAMEIWILDFRSVCGKAGPADCRPQRIGSRDQRVMNPRRKQGKGSRV